MDPYTQTHKLHTVGSLGHACPFTVHCAIIDGLNWYPNNEGVHGHVLRAHVFMYVCPHVCSHAFVWKWEGEGIGWYS